MSRSIVGSIAVPKSYTIPPSELQRDGRTVITLQERGQGWAVEVAVADVVALSPEHARALEAVR